MQNRQKEFIDIFVQGNIVGISIDVTVPKICNRLNDLI